MHIQIIDCKALLVAVNTDAALWSVALQGRMADIQLLENKSVSVPPITSISLGMVFFHTFI
jgi:hypothetical protein